MSNAIVETVNLTRHFVQGGQTLEVLRGVNLSLRAGELVALVGASGSGKSTLLQLIGLLDTPSGGDLILEGASVLRQSDAVRTRLRRQRIGFIYQYHHLLPEFSARENVMLPQMIAGVAQTQAAERADSLLKELGLEARLTHRPAELSGGEQQRVAIARALANEPVLILADEPTGNLDAQTSDSVFQMLLALAKRKNVTALVATHNQDLAKRMSRMLMMESGKLK